MSDLTASVTTSCSIDEMLDDGSAGPLIRALCQDTCCAVAFLDASGRVVHANSIFCKMWSNDGICLAGKMIEEFMSARMAEERRAIIGEVLSTGKPITAVGLLRGTLSRNVFRPIESGDSRLIASVTRCDSEHAVAPPKDDLPTRRVAHDDLGELALLTERELQVLRLIGQGMTTSEMSTELHRSDKTIEGHRLSLGNKLDRKNRVDLARLAIFSGLTRMSSAEVSEVARRAAAARRNGR